MAKSDHKRHTAKHKIDRRLGVNLWGRPKSTLANMAQASMVSAAKSQQTSEYSLWPSKS